MGVWIGVIVASVFMGFSLVWSLLERYAPGHPAARVPRAVARVPMPVWSVLAIAGFVLPVVVMWASAHSTGNALAGYLPWADAKEYFTCSQGHLLGESGQSCSKRPFYAVYFASLLWLTGNHYQLVLLLQAAILGFAVLLFVRELARELSGPGVLAAYSVLFLFAVMFCNGATMTENAGLFLGVLCIALLWRSAEAPHAGLICAALLLMAAAQNARPGAMFFLPAVFGWLIFSAGTTWRRRLGLAVVGAVSVAIGMAITIAPTFIVGGEPGQAHSNFSYSLYGVVAGGEGWLHVTVERPDLFTQEHAGTPVSARIYEAALESIVTRPHLFALGYVKGIGLYLERLFRYAHDFKVLELAGFYLAWIIGFIAVARRWREPRYSLLLWLQAGVFASAPFLIFDGGNRVFAATVALDALFVGLGVMRISGLAMRAEPIDADGRAMQAAWRYMVPAGMAFLVAPIAVAAFLYARQPASAYATPSCPDGSYGVVVRPAEGTLMLPLVEPGMEGIYPLRVRADQFADRMDKSVEHKADLRRPAGTTLVWGTRLDAGRVGNLTHFVWRGSALQPGQVQGFCIVPQEEGVGRSLGVATDALPAATLPQPAARARQNGGQ